MQICVNEIVYKHHSKESVQSFVSDIFLESASSVLQEVFHGDALCELFDEEVSGGMLCVWVGEPSSRAILKVLPEYCKIGSFDAQVQLQSHHFAKLFHLVWK